jgi:hypothetical protein
MLADKWPDPTTSFSPLQLTKHQFLDIFSKTNIGCAKRRLITSKFHTTVSDISEDVERYSRGIPSFDNQLPLPLPDNLTNGSYQ